MSPPTPTASGHDPNRAASDSPPAASVLALSGLLKVQRRWLLASAPDSDPEPEPARAPRHAGNDEAQRPPSGRSRPRTHLEEAEWSRLAVGVAAEVLSSLGIPAAAEVLQLYPDVVIVHLPTAEAARWPFLPGPTSESWVLPRDSRIIASLPVTPAILKAAKAAALVTLSESEGRRALVDLIAVGSTILKGPMPEAGEKIANVALELGTRRWSDLDSLILVALDGAMPPLERTVHAPDVAAALDELTVRSMNGSASASTCVIVPPWASDPADPVLGELVRYSEATEGAGVLCCASSEGALCLWELADVATGRPALTFGDGRRIPALDYLEVVDDVVAPGSPDSFHFSLTGREQTPAPSPPPRNCPIEVAVLGTVQVNGAPESFRQRRRLTELVAYLAMHPEGATSDAFATALWPERRVPMQTLANRLSEARKALGAAADGRARLRKQGGRHLIVEAETDWDRFRDLASEGRGADSWRRALALVRGRPFDGLDRGEWAQLEGFAAATEATVVGVACRLGEYSLGRAKPGIAHWAALQGLLVSPWDERLYRLLMRAADGMGNRGGVDGALRSLALALELEGDPLMGVHPETSALYRSLTSRSPT